MFYLILTAVVVGGATILGASFGLIFKDYAERYSRYIVSFAAGIMLAAAISGLILPATEVVEGIRLSEVLIGVISGALALYLIEQLFPIKDGDGGKAGAILLSLAIAIHNLPEGMAAGVAYGGADIESSLGVIFGIALHNLPEGVIAITPLIASGVGKGRAMLLAASGAIAEVAGTLIGYMAVSISEAVLPFLLSFAGGTMLTVIAGEMIPEAKGGRRATMVLILGFSLMVLLSSLLG